MFLRWDRNSEEILVDEYKEDLNQTLDVELVKFAAFFTRITEDVKILR
jgi:hypothetical protein